MTRLRVGSLFSGIGALDLGIERSGLGEIVYQCESDEFCRDILARHWPLTLRFADVRHVLGAVKVDIICGGFPCQGHSLAGKRKGTNDERWLWPEMFRVFRASGARILIVENVPGLRSSGLRDVLADLASVGADAYWATLPAWVFGAPHIRERIYLVAAYPDSLNVGDVAERVAGGLAQRVQATREAATRRAAEESARESGATYSDGVRVRKEQPRQAYIDIVGAGDPQHCSARSGGTESGQPRKAEPEPDNEQSNKVPKAADSDGLGRLQQARSFAEERGWAERCGWQLDRTPDPSAGVDDGAAGLLGLQRKALGNSVVVPVAEFFSDCIRAALAEHPLP